MFKKSILIMMLLLAIVVQERKAATCENGVCYKECGIGPYVNSFGDYDLGWCYTKSSAGLISKCSTNKDCSDKFKCLTKCTI